MSPPGESTRYRSTASSPLDRLARIVSSEAFALAFLWWATLVALAPLCFACAFGYHASGATHLGVLFGLTGVGVAGIAASRLTSHALRLRFASGS